MSTAAPARAVLAAVLLTALWIATPAARADAARQGATPLDLAPNEFGRAAMVSAQSSPLGIGAPAGRDHDHGNGKGHDDHGNGNGFGHDDDPPPPPPPGPPAIIIGTEITTEDGSGVQTAVVAGQATHLQALPR